MKLAHISDTHLSSRAAGTRAEQARRAWPHLAAALRHDRPDLIVHTGDHVLHDPEHDDDRTYARARARELDCDLRTVAGNHDVGTARDVTHRRLQRYRDVWGPDRWIEQRGPWQLVGINSQLLGSNLPAERQQFDWLREALRQRRAGYTALFCHQPLVLSRPDEPDCWALPPHHARRELIELLVTSPGVRLVATGHLHRHRTARMGPILHITAPSVAFAVPELADPDGDDRVGYLLYELSDDGDVVVELRHLPE